jgi:hypothetical protein
MIVQPVPVTQIEVLPGRRAIDANILEYLV